MKTAMEVFLESLQEIGTYKIYVSDKVSLRFALSDFCWEEIAATPASDIYPRTLIHCRVCVGLPKIDAAYSLDLGLTEAHPGLTLRNKIRGNSLSDYFTFCVDNIWIYRFDDSCLVNPVLVTRYSEDHECYMGAAELSQLLDRVAESA